METLTVLIGGLVVRLFLFILLFALFATPIVAVLYISYGARALHQRSAGTVDAGGAHWKPGLAYTTAHAWVRRFWGRNVKLGLDDVARRVLSGVSSIALPPVGTRLRLGDPFVSLRCGERVVAIPSPVEGVVIERNRQLTEQPALFEREPYRGGWLLRVETEADAPLNAWHGEASRQWLRAENRRLNRFLETQLGMAAADGGTLTAPPSRLLHDDAWREATRSFLRAA